MCSINFDFEKSHEELRYKQSLGYDITGSLNIETHRCRSRGVEVESCCRHGESEVSISEENRCKKQPISKSWKRLTTTVRTRRDEDTR